MRNASLGSHFSRCLKNASGNIVYLISFFFFDKYIKPNRLVETGQETGHSPASLEKRFLRTNRNRIKQLSPL